MFYWKYGWINLCNTHALKEPNQMILKGGVCLIMPSTQSASQRGSGSYIEKVGTPQEA